MLDGTVVYKVTGSGNDFVMLDGRTEPLERWTPELIQEICSRGTGVGADGFAVLQPGSRPGAVRFTARVAHPRLVRISEVWHPGWRAQIDGHPAELLRTDLTLIGLELPAGESRVELRFVPPGWHRGIAVAGVAALALLVLFLVPGSWHRQRQRPS